MPNVLAALPNIAGTLLNDVEQIVKMSLWCNLGMEKKLCTVLSNF